MDAQVESNAALSDASAATGAPSMHVGGGRQRFRDGLTATREAVQTLGFSAALWMLYVPHYVVLRALGPRWGMAWVRCAANIHWLLTFVGAQRSARGAIAAMKPYFDCKASVSYILRRHLQLKHECFARVRVYSLHAADGRGNDMHWNCSPESAAALPGEKRERGLVIVGFHFNFFQTFAAGLAEFFPNDNLVQLRYRTSRCVENASSPIVQIALRKAMEADRRAGANVFYIDDIEAIIQLYRLLRQKGVVAVTADGGAAGEFVDVPFFDGTLRVPSGWAKLAAGTKSDIVLICDKELNSNSREGLFYNHVSCTESTDESAYRAIAAAIRVLEFRIKEEPWGWHPWQRLRVDVDANGVRRYSLKQYGFDEGVRLTKKSIPNIPDQQRQRNTDGPSLPRPAAERRVAIVANSLPPYRVQLHEQLVQRYQQVDLWSVTTHSNAYYRWGGLMPPASIKAIEFGLGEPTNEQPLLRYSWREWRKGGRIIKWLKQRRIDAVLVQGCGDMGRMRIIHWCQLNNIECYLTGDFNICSDNHPLLKRILKHAVYTRAVRWSTGLMPCGQHGLSLLHRYGGESKPAFIFPFVPDIQMFQHPSSDRIAAVRERFHLPADRRRIIFSARMMSTKRPDLAVRSFLKIAALRPEWDMVLVGDGPLRAKVEVLVPERLRARFVWTGFVNDTADLAALYNCCDLLLLPSDHEPWGVVSVEAVAAGLAIVASDVVGAAPELVREGVNGELFRASHLESLEDALLRVTEPARIDALKTGSHQVFADWFASCNPVETFGRALGVTTTNERSETRSVSFAAMESHERVCT